MGGAQPDSIPSAAIRTHSPILPLLRNSALSLFLFLSLILAACGGSEGSTPTPSGTVTNISSSNGQNSDTEPFSKEEKIFVGAGQFEEVPVTLRQGDLLKIDYKAEVRVSPGFGGTAAQERPIRIAVLDVDGNELINESDMSAGSLELTADLNGEHRIVLLNPFPLEALTVTLNYSVNM
jgi:hypothetical protein